MPPTNADDPLLTTVDKPSAPPDQGVTTADARAASVEGGTASYLPSPAQRPGGTDARLIISDTIFPLPSVTSAHMLESVDPT
jgi:hypothetical protein